MIKSNKVLKIIGIVLIAFVIIISFYTLIINRNEIINKLPVKYLVVKSNSMNPTLCIDDIIIIAKQKEYKVGDIIAYNYEGKYLITHRIIQEDNKDFITKGDNNNSPDKESVNIESVQGKVIFVIDTYKKHISILIILILILISAIWKGIKKWEI